MSVNSVNRPMTGCGGHGNEPSGYEIRHGGYDDQLSNSVPSVPFQTKSRVWTFRRGFFSTGTYWTHPNMISRQFTTNLMNDPFRERYFPHHHVSHQTLNKLNEISFVSLPFINGNFIALRC